MPGITRKLHVAGTEVRSGKAIYQHADACDACGCLVQPEYRRVGNESHPTGRKRCSGRCGIVSDAIPASELGITGEEK